MAQAAPSPAAVEAEERAQLAIAKLCVLFARQDLLDAWRAEQMIEIQAVTKDLAKARGVPFLRLEAVRKECDR